MKRILSIVLVVAVCSLLMISVSAFATDGTIIISGGSSGSNPPLYIGGDNGSIFTEPQTGTSSAGNIIISGGSGTHSSSGTPSNAGTIYVNPDTTINSQTTSPVITKNPGSETVESGKSAVFTAYADNATAITWYLTDASGSFRIPAAAVGQYIKGAAAQGAYSERLTLSGISEGMNGWIVQAEFSNGSGSAMTSGAWISVTAAAPTPTPTPSATNTPMPTATPMPSATPTPFVNNTGGASAGGTSNTNGTGVISNKPGTVSSNASAPKEPTSGANGASGNASGKDSGYNSITGSDGSGIDDAKVTNTAGMSTEEKSHTGAYVLAAAAGAVIIGAVAVMGLYMKGKISLGKFENIIGGEEEANPDGSEFYNPDDFKGNDKEV